MRSTNSSAFSRRRAPEPPRRTRDEMTNPAEQDPPATGNRVAVITGAGSPTGIGAACARALAPTHHLLVAATSPRIDDRVRELRASGCDAVGFVGDLSVSTMADALIALAVQRWG